MKTMTEADRLILEQFVPFREKVIEAIKAKHPYIVSIVEQFLSGKRNSVGLKVTEDGKVAGEYTFHLNGIHIENTETGKILPEVHHPLLGIVKPVVSIERSAVENAIKDPLFFEEPFQAVKKLLPNITVAFLS